MKVLIFILTIFLIPFAYADPYLTCDAQEGVEEYEFECGDYNSITPALSNGAMAWDFGTWTGGHGWFDCTVKARASYAVKDVVTGVITKVAIESGPSSVRIKIPNINSAANYKLAD